MISIHTRLLIAALITLAILPTLKSHAAAPNPKPNILFIAVDDLRPELNCYGSSHIKSPNIDKLALQGTLFTNAYCQQAVCSPSRTSLMTGLRPDSTGVYDLETHFRKNIPNVITLSQQFKSKGYTSVGFGKIYHGSLNDNRSWSEQFKSIRAPGYMLKSNTDYTKTKRREGLAKGLKGKQLRRYAQPYPYEMADVDESNYRDHKIASASIQRMQQLAKANRPFFLAVGFAKPHLPFNAPKKYWDLYDRNKIQLPPKTTTTNIPSYANSNWGELRNYRGMPRQGNVTDSQAKELIHGYYACVSFVDAQIGRLLQSLKQLNIEDNTIIVLWGDHGWKLGEYGSWCKHTNYEIDTRVPLIAVSPWQKNKGTASDALVEFVDIYPTLCDLANIPQPKHLEGTSFAPLLDNPLLTWKSAAFSQYPHSTRLGQSRIPLMGYSMRTAQYHLVRWVKKTTPPTPNTKAIALELYDHKTDPKELNNIANKPENIELITQLIEQAKRGWQHAKPKPIPQPTTPTTDPTDNPAPDPASTK